MRLSLALSLLVACQAPAGVSQSESAVGSQGFNYYGGPIMSACTPIYYIWYGGWTGSEKIIAMMVDLAQSLGGSPFLNLATGYSDSTGAHPQDCFRYGGMIYDHYHSTGARTIPDQTVKDNIAWGYLPADSNAIYAIMTTYDANYSGFPDGTEAYHLSTNYNGTILHYTVVGRVQNTSSASLNGDSAADEEVWLGTHEILESLTDPNYIPGVIANPLAWYAPACGEVADCCELTAPQKFTVNGYGATFHGHSHYFDLPTIWLNTGSGQCAQASAIRADDLICTETTAGNVWVARAPGNDGNFTNTGFVGGWCPGNNTQLLSGDLNGDGKTDLLCHQADSTGANKYILSDGTNFTAGGGAMFSGCSSGGVLFLADWDGDGYSDYLCQDLRFGSLSVVFANPLGPPFGSTQGPGVSFSTCTGKGVTLDANGDGKSDFACLSSTGTWSLILSTGRSGTSSNSWFTSINNWCPSSWQILAADFSGDGIGDVLCHDPSSGWTQAAYGGLGYHTLGSSFTWCGGKRLLSGDANHDNLTDLYCNDPVQGITQVSDAGPTGFTNPSTRLGGGWCSGATSHISSGDVNGRN